jgi:hypothetical protein
MAITVTVAPAIIMAYNFGSMFDHFTVFYPDRPVSTGPVVAIFNVAAIAYNGLACMSPIIGVFGTIYGGVGPWPWLVHNNLVTVVYIKSAISWW